MEDQVAALCTKYTAHFGKVCEDAFLQFCNELSAFVKVDDVLPFSLYTHLQTCFSILNPRSRSTYIERAIGSIVSVHFPDVIAVEALHGRLVANIMKYLKAESDGRIKTTPKAKTLGQLVAEGRLSLAAKTTLKPPTPSKRQRRTDLVAPSEQPAPVKRARVEKATSPSPPRPSRKLPLALKNVTNPSPPVENFVTHLTQLLLNQDASGFLRRNYVVVLKGAFSKIQCEETLRRIACHAEESFQPIFHSFGGDGRPLSDGKRLQRMLQVECDLDATVGCGLKFLAQVFSGHNASISFAAIKTQPHAQKQVLHCDDKPANKDIEKREGVMGNMPVFMLLGLEQGASLEVKLHPSRICKSMSIPVGDVLVGRSRLLWHAGSSGNSAANTRVHVTCRPEKMEAKPDTVYLPVNR